MFLAAVSLVLAVAVIFLVKVLFVDKAFDAKQNFYKSSLTMLEKNGSPIFR